MIYGDNLAAIGMAHGTATSTWRTRHLRVRASFLKEALDSGAWKLLHLRGEELVADGLTKPLCGQAFGRFLEDLGLYNRDHQDEPMESGGRGAAIAALMTGGLLLSGLDAEEEQEANSDTLWVCGAMLMMLGAIYLGQLTFQGVQCCLKRLQVLLRSGLGSPGPTS